MLYLDAAGKDVTTDITKATMTTFPVNNLMHSLFKQVTLTLNNKQISPNSQNYAYRSYMEQVYQYFFLICVYDANNKLFEIAAQL